MKNIITTIATTCGLAIAASAQTNLFDLNSPSQLTIENRAGGGSATEQTTGGISNSRYITAADFSTAQFTAIAQSAYSADLSGDLTLTQSVYFKTAATQSGSPTDGQDAVILGISDAPTQTPTNENLISSGLTNNYLATSIRVSNESNLDLQFHGFTTGDIAPFGPAGGGTTVSVTADAWYFFQVDYAYRNGSDDWLFTYTLNESTDAGIVGSQLFNLTLNGAIRGNDFGASPDLYGFIGGDASRSSRIEGFDNATLVSGAVPEPSSYGLLTGALALGWILVRRRS